MTPKPPTQIFCIDCSKATPVIEGVLPLACAHCDSPFPAPTSPGVDIAAIPASGMETATDEPDLDPDKFWEIPAAFKSREEADAHHSRVFRRKIGTLIIVLIAGIAATQYLKSTAPPYTWSDSAKASVALDDKASAQRLTAVDTAVAVIEAPDLPSLKALIAPTDSTESRMTRYYNANNYQQGDVTRIESITQHDENLAIYQIHLRLKNSPTKHIEIDLSGATPTINWEAYSDYPTWSWHQFLARKNSMAHEVFVRAKQISPSDTAIEATGIPPQNALGLALWHTDKNLPSYSVVDRTTPLGQAIEAATSPETPTEIILTLTTAPDPAPSFLVVVREFIQAGW